MKDEELPNTNNLEKQENNEDQHAGQSHALASTLAGTAAQVMQVNAGELRPELKHFIARVIVPILIQRYIAAQKRSTSPKSEVER